MASGSQFSQAVWSKRPTYEEILRGMDKDYKVRLPDRVALHFYDSFAMTQFREMQQQTEESEAQKDEHRQTAFATAAPTRAWADTSCSSSPTSCTSRASVRTMSW